MFRAIFDCYGNTHISIYIYNIIEYARIIFGFFWVCHARSDILLGTCRRWVALFSLCVSVHFPILLLLGVSAIARSARFLNFWQIEHGAYPEQLCSHRWSNPQPYNVVDETGIEGGSPSYPQNSQNATSNHMQKLRLCKEVPIQRFQIDSRCRALDIEDCKEVLIEAAKENKAKTHKIDLQSREKQSMVSSYCKYRIHKSLTFSFNHASL